MRRKGLRLPQRRSAAANAASYVSSYDAASRSQWTQWTRGSANQREVFERHLDGTLTSIEFWGYIVCLGSNHSSTLVILNHLTVKKLGLLLFPQIDPENFNEHTFNPRNPILRDILGGITPWAPKFQVVRVCFEIGF